MHCPQRLNQLKEASGLAHLRSQDQWAFLFDVVLGNVHKRHYITMFERKNVRESGNAAPQRTPHTRAKGHAMATLTNRFDFSASCFIYENLSLNAKIRVAILRVMGRNLKFV